MNKQQQTQFDSLYGQHVNALVRQGKSKVTIDAYSRAIRRIAAYFDQCPDQLTIDDLNDYFTNLIKTHSWSTVKLDRYGLQFFYQHVLVREWAWNNIVKPPRVQTLPDILSADEIARMINGTREPRYQTFILATYTLGLRLGETLKLAVGDIDAAYPRVHIRRAKGHKDRYVTLPNRTLLALRRYWSTHRHASLLFPAGATAEARPAATAAMDRRGLQKAFKIIARDCGIRKQVHIHTLRHCYGAHLVEAGLHLRALQHELGHADPKTTALYTQLTRPTQQNTLNLVNALADNLEITLVGKI